MRDQLLNERLLIDLDQGRRLTGAWPSFATRRGVCCRARRIKGPKIARDSSRREKVHGNCDFSGCMNARGVQAHEIPAS